MTNNNHPITLPDELVQQWANEYWFPAPTCSTSVSNSERYIAMQAACWGYEQRGVVNKHELQKARDQELEACCKWMAPETPESYINALRAARRPESPSLKEQALQALENADGADHPVVTTVLTADQHALIRKALEQLDD